MAERQFVTFYLDSDFFGIDILLVREINRNLDITPVELAPPFVRGLLNLRGQVVTVIDLGVRLGIGQRTITRNSSCIVLKTQHELTRSATRDRLQDGTSLDLVGLLVDYIGDVAKVDESEIEPPPVYAGSVDVRYLSGVITLDKQLLVTLKTTEVLSSAEPVTAR